ncbi:MAG: type II toxin-antitoxin system VapC family toxin [bacterium]|nr:type II toxin-antitoxin system VapC family toxin [Gammaproteobacteria bacterium]HIL95689.1 type II toxin-antitoxin system VapC family toxin [Pseudomonadales bacterium]
MIIDTSVLVAILFNEADAGLYAQALAMAEHRLISAASYLESGIVIDRQKGAAAGRQLDSLIVRAEVKVEPVTRAQADIARQAYMDFGKGAHPAGLNFGDCFSYALAKSLGMPLLYKGQDFSQTDIESAL